jgi:serine protease Do
MTAQALATRARELQEAFVEAVKRVQPAVVHIKVEKSVGTGLSPFMFPDPFEEFFGFRRPRQPRYRAQGQGSGVIVRPDGLILTNHHVAGEADSITVKLADGREFPGKLVGTDPPTDIAAIRIGGRGHPSAELGDSDGIEIGQWALAIGNPFGLEHTVTLGIVSARGRRGIVGMGGGYEDFIQTDAAVNPGNSGGPLIDIDGKVIGINTAIFSRSGGYQGIGFAIPSNMARTILDRLVTAGRVERAWLGVGIEDVTADLARALGLASPEGVVVTRVFPGSPAEEAGFRRYDVVVGVEGRRVKDANALRNRVAHTPVGSTVEIEVLRDGNRRTLRAKLAELPTDKAAPPSPTPGREEREDDGRLGVTLTPMTTELARRYRYEDADGLLVVRVKSGGPAAAAGISPGEVILQVNRRSVGTLEDFARAVSAREPDEPLLLLVRGSDGERLVVIR